MVEEIVEKRCVEFLPLAALKSVLDRLPVVSIEFVLIFGCLAVEDMAANQVALPQGYAFGVQILKSTSECIMVVENDPDNLQVMEC